MESYWPWWLGAAALAVVVVGFAASARRGFGVSGIYARLLNWREERQAERVQQHFEAKLASTPGAKHPVAPTPISHGLTFVGFLFVGGLLSSLSTGDAGLRMSLGTDFDRLMGTGWTAWLALVFGGTLIGFGTRMAGGCTSGHGLFGCGRLQPASLVATAAFFGAAVAVSHFLRT